MIFRWLAAIFCLADLAASAAGVSSGFLVEANPVYYWFGWGGIAVAKAAYLAVTCWLFPYAYPETKEWVPVIVAGLSLGVVGHTIRLLILAGGIA